MPVVHSQYFRDGCWKEREKRKRKSKVVSEKHVEASEWDKEEWKFHSYYATPNSPKIFQGFLLRQTRVHEH